MENKEIMLTAKMLILASDVFINNQLDNVIPEEFFEDWSVPERREYIAGYHKRFGYDIPESSYKNLSGFALHEYLRGLQNYDARYKDCLQLPVFASMHYLADKLRKSKDEPMNNKEIKLVIDLLRLASDEDIDYIFDSDIDVWFFKGWSEQEKQDFMGDYHKCIGGNASESFLKNCSDLERQEYIEYGHSYIGQCADCLQLPAFAVMFYLSDKLRKELCA